MSVPENVLSFLVALQVYPGLPQDVRDRAVALLEEIYAAEEAEEK